MTSDRPPDPPACKQCGGHFGPGRGMCRCPRQKTHYDGCWKNRNHHDCAVAEIERLTQRLAAAESTCSGLRCDLVDTDRDRRTLMTALRGGGECYVCGADASCVGRYEGHGSIEFSCDEHCGHGNEDGWCHLVSLETERPLHVCKACDDPTCHPDHPVFCAEGDTDRGRRCGRCGFAVPGGFKHTHYVWCERHDYMNGNTRRCSSCTTETIRAVCPLCGSGTERLDTERPQESDDE